MASQDEELPAELRAAEERLAAARAAFAEEAARRWRPPPAAVSKLRQAVQRAFDSACGELEAKHGALVRLDRRNTYTLEHRCSLLIWMVCMGGRDTAACHTPLSFVGAQGATRGAIRAIDQPWQYHRGVRG